MSAPGEAGAAARPAATVIVLREGASGLELLMVRRARGMAFMADAWVFPGGRVDEGDGADDARFARAAARELAEEAGLVLAPASFVPFARWVTPSAEPRRFDARFFLAPLVGEQRAREDSQETVAVRWAAPRAFLDDHARGALKLPPPTLCTLEHLVRPGTVAAALAWAAAQPLSPIQPKLVPEPPTIVLPWDPGYAALPGEGEPLLPDHPAATRAGRLTLMEGRWVGDWDHD